MSKTILFDKPSRKICSILINRPHRRNAIDLETIKDLKGALEKFQDDDSLQVAILGGVAGNFSSGYDLNELISRNEDRSYRANIDQIKRMLWPIGTKLSNTKITIAAISGHAAGFGYELALKCDLRVAERDSRMGFMNRRFGIPIMNGGTVMLPKLIGFARAKELIATGKAQLAPEALQYGSINYISDVGCALGRSMNLARCLAKFGKEALDHDMQSIEEFYSANTTDLLERERTTSLNFLAQQTDLHVAGKFLEGQLARHGNYDMGNLLTLDPEITL